MNKKIVFKDKVIRVGNHRKLPNKRVVEISIDKKLPKKYIKPIVYHEKMEDNLQRKKGMCYKEAHKRATQMEKKRFFKGKERQWRNELSAVSKIYKENKK